MLVSKSVQGMMLICKLNIPINEEIDYFYLLIMLSKLAITLKQIFTTFSLTIFAD